MIVIGKKEGYLLLDIDIIWVGNCVSWKEMLKNIDKYVNIEIWFR